MYTILGVIAKPLGMLLDLLYGFIGNYGICIIIFTVVVKVCLYPLYIKQIKSTAKMSDLQPKMQEIQKISMDFPKPRQRSHRGCRMCRMGAR